MSKKTNKKKKINIKLESGQTFLIEDLQIILHIQKTYASMLRAQSSPEDKAIYTRVIEAINLAIENVYVSSEESSDDENYWS